MITAAHCKQNCYQSTSLKYRWSFFVDFHHYSLNEKSQGEISTEIKHVCTIFRYKWSKNSSEEIFGWFGAIWRAWSTKWYRLLSGETMEMHIKITYNFILLILLCDKCVGGPVRWSRGRYSSYRNQCPWKLYTNPRFKCKWHCIDSPANSSPVYRIHTTDLFTNSKITGQKLWWYSVDSGWLWSNWTWYLVSETWVYFW